MPEPRCPGGWQRRGRRGRTISLQWLPEADGLPQAKSGAAAGPGAGSADEGMLAMKCGGAGSGGSRRRRSALPARWEGAVSAGKVTWLSSPTAEPDKQLSLASRNRLSVTVAGSGRREGGLAGRAAGLRSPCLPPRARQVPPAPRGALRAGCPPISLGAPGWASCSGSWRSPELAQILWGAGTHAVGTPGWYRVGAACSSAGLGG